MSIPTYVPRSDYTGGGNKDDYTFDFTVTDKSQILIVKYDDDGEKVWQVDGNDLDYLSSVTINTDGGGEVVLAADLELDYTLAIIQNAIQPIFPKDYSKSTHWTLAQIQASFDYVMLQLQSIAYKVNRAPILGKLLSQEDADAFDTDVEVLAEGVIAFNEDGDGFEVVPRSAFKGDPGDPGANGTDGADGAPGVGVERAGNESLTNGQDTIIVTFSSPVLVSNYVPSVLFKNAAAEPLFFPQYMVTAWDQDGFTITLNAPVPSNNYIMSWSVLDEA